jgi:hypothetical protein
VIDVHAHEPDTIYVVPIKSDSEHYPYPALRGTIRDHVTKRRRPFVRFFACEDDRSHDAPDAPLPAAVAAGDEPFVIIGALAGG